MNQRISDRIDQIALNMDRLRWMPAINCDRYLLVNIPDYKLTVYEGAQRALDMRVIVGSATTPTPVFNDQLNHIVFSPTWTVPVSIVRNEIIPNLRKDSTYYSEKNFVIYKQDVQIDPALENWKDPNINPYQLRVVQNPGADNSLGSVKFMMPNNMSVYLHDTPSRRLFAKDYRALSHGCVRLGEPAKLAAYLLKDQQGWDADRISKAMSGSSPATILLKKRYPVYLMYQTAWVDDDGLLQFREDIYGHDKVQLKQLRPVRGTVTAVAISAAGM
jgi:murein L,D-transpeptidase YcbB/YkuD